MKTFLMLSLTVCVMISMILAGCSPEIICNKPYIRVGTGCCVDTNDNYICDSDENNGTATKQESNSVAAAVNVLTDNNTEATITTELSQQETEEVPEESSVEITELYWQTANPKVGNDNELTIEFKNSGDKGVNTISYVVELYFEEKLEDTKEYIFDDFLAKDQEVKEHKKFEMEKKGRYRADVYLKGLPDTKKDAKASAIESTSSSSDDEEEEEITGCTDTDDGKKYDTKGTCEDALGSNIDGCRNNAVMEWYCSDADKCMLEMYNCPDECAGGMCI